MSTKIIKVMVNVLCQDDFENSFEVKVFTDPKLAKKYFKELIDSAKEQEEELDLDDYTIDEDDTSYERYLSHRASEESLKIWMEDDEICEELNKTNDLENEYEI